MRKKLALALMAGMTALGAFSAGAEEAAGTAGVTVSENADSKTGYTATFVYNDAEAQSVKIMGGFTFYRENDIYAISSGWLNPDSAVSDPEHLLTPETWETGAARYGDAGYVADMTLDEETGSWTISVDLPGGSYLYQYVVIAADGNETTITDPANVPGVNALGAGQTRSQFYVPYDAEKQAETDDWTYVTPIDDENAKGEILWTEYEGLQFEGSEGTTHQMMIYLPAGYDADREEAYKLLFLSHGGGGEEGDWINQGNANNIADRLIADGQVEPTVIVFPDISEGTDAERTQNIMEYILPYMEENYNVSDQAEERAFAGLSMGGKLTYAVYQTEGNQFGYFGVFSVGHPSSDYSILDAVALNQPTLYLGVGYADATYDHAFQVGQIPMAPFSIYLTKAGVEYEGLKVVEGGHDWFTWQQLLQDFMITTLWK